MLKIYLLLIFSFLTINSEAAGLRCFDLFSVQSITNKKSAPLLYAEALDQLNEKYNLFLFKENLADILQPDFTDSTITERTVARYQAYKLRKILKQLTYHDQFLKANSESELNIYELEQIAVRLEKLSFLTDESVTRNMTKSEQILFRQAQHSLLSQGLAKFLFSEEAQPTKSKIKKVYRFIMTPFKDIYFRWTYAIAMAPKLNGSVIPYDVIEKVVWNGYDENKILLEPYLKKSLTKYYFNTFSSIYNWTMASVIIFSAGQFFNTTYHDVYLQGQVKAEQILSPNLQNSEKLAKNDWHQYKQDLRLQNAIKEFKALYQRDPNPEEISFFQQMIQSTDLNTNIDRVSSN